MLEPNSRQLLRDALRPPLGYALDRAVTTTFSLDLMALLTVPVSFTFFQMRDEDGPPAVDPMALLESLRRYASRITVFCQAGQIHVPRQIQLLLGYLEESVHQVQAPRGGVFHPKLTVLRFVADGSVADDQVPPVVYRLLCSSRNLTFDRSWDTMLVLDGPLAGNRKNAFTANRPLSRFVAALPALALQPMATTAAAHVNAMADELLRVAFVLPSGFDEVEFFPLGLDGPVAWPVLRHRRTLAMAPFVDEAFIRRFADAEQPLRLISRAECLDELSVEALRRLSGAWYMSTAADPVPDIGVEPEIATGGTVAVEEAAVSHGDRVELAPAFQLHGLHAKLFVCDDGRNAHVYTGSANATTAAFERNVEFMVRLTGKKSRCGIDALLETADVDESGKDRSLRFTDLLVKYERETPPQTDAMRKALERLLDDARYAIAGGKLTATVESVPGDATCARYRVTIRRDAAMPLSVPDGVTVSCHPLSLRPSNAIAVPTPVGSPVAVFEPLSFEALTSFFAFRLTARIAAGSELSCAFVLNVPLIGAPPDRAGRLLLALLRNREQLLRYLLMLLADDEADARRLVEAFDADQVNHHADGAGGGFCMPLLEPLLQALDRRPARLDQIARLVQDLGRTPEGRALVSDEFLSVWEPVWAAKEGTGHADE